MWRGDTVGLREDFGVSSPLCQSQLDMYKCMKSRQYHDYTATERPEVLVDEAIINRTRKVSVRIQ